MYIDVFLGECCGEKSYFAAEKLTYDDVGYNLNSFNFLQVETEWLAQVQL